MDPEVQALFEAATDVKRGAYVPYSGFAVGAALRDERGRIHVGCNVENASYPEGLCAEAGAVAAMVASGGRQIVEVLVVADSELVTTCCGGCRQKLREFAGPSTPVHSADSDGVRRTFTLAELLPQSFGPDHLPSASPPTAKT